MIRFYFYFVCLFCFVNFVVVVGLFVGVYFQVCVVVVIVLVSFCWFGFFWFFFVCFSFLERSAVFISV